MLKGMKDDDDDDDDDGCDEHTRRKELLLKRLKRVKKDLARFCGTRDLSGELKARWN